MAAPRTWRAPSGVMTSRFGKYRKVAARAKGERRRRRWTRHLALVSGVVVLVIALFPAPGSSGDAQPATTTTTTSTTTAGPTTTTEAVEPDVAGKVLDRAPAKVLTDLDEMPRTGGRDDRLVAGVGWILLGVGLLLVDGAGALVRRRARR